MKCFIHKEGTCTCTTDFGLLLVRLALAVVFIAHGWQKLGGMEGVIGFFGSLGLPSTMAYAVALVELLGGIAMLLGVFTMWAGFLLAAVMVGAIVLVKWEKGFFNGGWEFDITLLLCALAVAVAGPGMISISGMMKKGKAEKTAP